MKKTPLRLFSIYLKTRRPPNVNRNFSRTAIFQAGTRAMGLLRELASGWRICKRLRERYLSKASDWHAAMKRRF
jgi:hypothetical protein